MDKTIDGRRVNKVWAQPYRTKMSSAIYVVVTKIMRDRWYEKLEKEDEILMKKIKKEAKDITKYLKSKMKSDSKLVTTDSIGTDWLSEEAIIYSAQTKMKSVHERLENMGIPANHWHNAPDTPARCTELLGSDINALADIGHALLEFMRTGHINEWVDVCEIVRAIHQAVDEVDEKENK